MRFSLQALLEVSLLSLCHFLFLLLACVGVGVRTAAVLPAQLGTWTLRSKEGGVPLLGTAGPQAKWEAFWTRSRPPTGLGSAPVMTPSGSALLTVHHSAAVVALEELYLGEASCPLGIPSQICAGHSLSTSFCDRSRLGSLPGPRDVDMPLVSVPTGNPRASVTGSSLMFLRPHTVLFASLSL